MSMELITGGCACGAVRYRTKGPIGFHILCQCRFCQRFSGSVHSALLAVPKAGLVIEGPAKGYSYDNGLGGIRLHVFCSICGSGIHGGNPDEDFVTLIASSLDDPSLFAPTEVINRDEAAPWHKKAPSLILHDEAGETSPNLDETITASHLLRCQREVSSGTPSTVNRKLQHKKCNRTSTPVVSQ